MTQHFEMEKLSCGCQFTVIDDCFWFQPCTPDCQWRTFVTEECERQGKPFSTLDLSTLTHDRLCGMIIQ